MLEDELAAEWRRKYPHRPPHVWGDETEVIAAVFERRLEVLTKVFEQNQVFFAGKISAIEKRLHHMGSHAP
jgi:hypothetical protein